jgi:hypothetical protein
MADSPSYPDSGDDTGVGSDRGSTTGTPRWVKVFGIVVAVLVVLFIVVLFTGGGGHGPGRHIPSGDARGQAPLSNITEGHAPSDGLGDHVPHEGGYG